MMGARIRSTTAETLVGQARALREAGGRMQFAYAWSPNGDGLEVRYVAALPGRQGFEMWFLKSGNEIPSLAHVWPLLGWYEREMTDLNGINFAGHPEPHPLVLRDGAPSRGDGHDFLEHPPMNGKHHLPIVNAKDVQRLPFGPIRADVFEVSGIHFLLRRRAHPLLSAEAFFQASWHGDALRRLSARSRRRHRRAGLRRGIHRSCARVLRGRRTCRGLRCAGSGARASRTARGA